MWGAYGDSSTTKSFRAAAGRGAGHLVAALTNSIMAEMPVLNRRASVSSVTRLMVLWTARSWSGEGLASGSVPPSNRRQARPRKRYTPSTPLVLHTLVSLRGPMNISYSRRESAPKRSTTSSGFTTLPRDLLILWARADTREAGSPLRQYPSPAFSISAAATLVGMAPSDSGSAGWPSGPFHRVYSVSPRIMPWLTSRWNGSGPDTAPMSNSTLCQKRA
mmetsp:Transcript_21063/g.63392  ORF Transcript_21063/g.63392 Transcript_21063/m.63392 type:complete len:219 (-) Transcript_21063:2255-2911(-)